jgi:DUF4097 and DUF4098 domain-containing protein YvlB
MPERSSIRMATLSRMLFVFLLLAPVVFASDDWNFEDTRTDVRDFVSGGMLHVRLGVGDVRITRGDSSRIRLRYTVKSRHERNVKEAKVDFDVHGNDANIELHAPSGGNTSFDVELEVPQTTNLDVHDKVGDLNIDGIEGDKDLELSVGDIRVTADQDGYRTVRATTSIGDVSGSGYGETSGWLGKTLRYNGGGKYELRAHVSVGDITLEGK